MSILGISCRQFSGIALSLRQLRQVRLRFPRPRKGHPQSLALRRPEAQ
jgi:hypothetical protein